MKWNPSVVLIGLCALLSAPLAASVQTTSALAQHSGPSPIWVAQQDGRSGLGRTRGNNNEEEEEADDEGSASDGNKGGNRRKDKRDD